jgi:antitoxin component YwqK of YwqJK toxin-antitoxin module
VPKGARGKDFTDLPRRQVFPFTVSMKNCHRVLYASICCFALFILGGCGDAPVQSSDGESDSVSDNVDRHDAALSPAPPPGQSQPSAPSRADEPTPSDDWSGNSAYYLAKFEERYENAERQNKILVEIPVQGEEREGSKPTLEEQIVSEPVEVKRLYVRAVDQPYNGRITRLYLSGSPEYQANFESGFRKGVAHWWSPDGELVRAATGWGNDLEEVDVNTIVNPFDKVVAEVASREPESSRHVFRGSAKSFEEWNKYDPDNRLTDAITGEVVSGQVKLYGDDGKLQSESNYQDGLVHGFSNSYHSNGVQATKTVFSNGDKAGTETWWGDNGLKSYEANFVDGKLNGLETIWSDDGSISSQLRYNDGKLVETVYTKE